MKTTDDLNELFVHVDENDQVLGQVVRRKAQHNPKFIHRGVWVLVFNEQNELFMQKRSLTKDKLPGYWSLSVGGHVTYGQEYEEAAIREFNEELGEKSKLKYTGKYMFTAPSEREIGVIYKTIHNGPFVLHPQEISEGRFFKLPDLEELIQQKKIEVTNWALAILQKVCGIIPERKDVRKLIIKEFFI